MTAKIPNNLILNVKSYNDEIIKLKPLEILEWGYKTFSKNFAITTSFGIQSSVLLHILSKSSIKNKIKIFWIDTGYLPYETYQYAEELSKKLDLKITTVQSDLSPARMEALYGKLWENNNSEDLDRYHEIRKIKPLENALSSNSIFCWGSGVRSQQTDNRSQMKFIEIIRGRLSLRPLLGWTNKNIFYYMKENSLPNHPLFDKGYSTVGDWHSSQADTSLNKGRDTRFGGIKQECGLHIDQ